MSFMSATRFTKLFGWTIAQLPARNWLLYCPQLSLRSVEWKWLDMWAVVWEMFSLSAKGRADNHVKQKCTHTHAALLWPKGWNSYCSSRDSEKHLHILDQEKGPGAEEGRDDEGTANKKGIFRTGWGFPHLGRAALHLGMSAWHSPLSSPRAVFPCRLIQASRSCGIWLYLVWVR